MAKRGLSGMAMVAEYTITAPHTTKIKTTLSSAWSKALAWLALAAVW